VGYLPQQAVSGSTLTVWEECRKALTGLNRKRETLERAEAAVAAQEEGAVEKLDLALEAFRRAGGFREDELIGEVLHGLGFRPDEWHRTCDTFSGGWQMRIALARLLLSDPDVAILDEPTNHLDLLARGWLGRFLANAPFATVIVSHDRYLLDAVVNEVLEVRNKRVHRFSGNYSSFLTQRQLQIDQQQTAYVRQQAELERLQGFVDRFRAKATKAAQAQSRQKRIDKMDRVEQVRHEGLPSIQLPESPPSANVALTLKDAVIGWPDGPAILNGVDLELVRGMRLAVLGTNGCGKSTLLHALAGRLPLTSGQRKVGDRARIGVFTQDLAAELPMDVSAMAAVMERAPLATPEQVRSVLGALGLSGGAGLRRVGDLSGGEKARVALAGLTARAHNVLLLDEPTNHLDVETVDVLADALAAFDGAMLVVTHDRALVERCATHVGRVIDGKLTIEEGVRPEDFLLTARTKQAKADTGGAVEYAERKRLQREAERATRRIQEIEETIESLDAEGERLDAALFECATDFSKATALGEERANVDQKLEALYAEWEDLESVSPPDA
jgi:ATP-binding cassette subfamily F protein 3